jgi:hypothetical protein
VGIGGWKERREGEVTHSIISQVWRAEKMSQVECEVEGGGPGRLEE